MFKKPTENPKTERRVLKPQTSLGMKFLLAVGLMATAFSLFLFYSTWQSNQAFKQEMLKQQIDLAMAFDISMQDVLCPESNSYPGYQPEGTEGQHSHIEHDNIFVKMQFNYQQKIVQANGENLEKLLKLADISSSEIRQRLQSSSTARMLDLRIRLKGKEHMAKFRIHEDHTSSGQGELHMIAIPLDSYNSDLMDETLGRFSAMMFALLGLFGAVYTFFQWLVAAPLHRIERYFHEAANENPDFRFEPLEIRSRDEIGRLAESFNLLGEKLSAAYQTLESKVRMRTFELQQSNTRLRQKVRQCQQAEEQAHVLAEEAQTANRAKSEFLANMSHEIRTPMNAIVGFSDLLAEDSLTEEQLSYIRMISKSSRNLLALINDILDYSKVEAGKLVISPVECRIGELLGEIESMLRPQAIQKQIDFEMFQCDFLPEVIYVDTVRVRQCLINLISNAVKFTHEGHVYVNITLQNVSGRPFVRFDVEDTGIGIPDDKLSLIFESFTQVDGATTRKYGGTGLGLTITKKLADLMGGQISVSSLPGKGSVFTILLPTNVQWPDVDTAMWNKYKLVDVINEMSDTEKGSFMFNGKILVAEDNPSNQKLITILLQKIGVQVTIADDGAKAIEKCAAESFDLILMDMQMPNMNGYDATRELRKKGLKTLIIAVTANAMMGDEDKCIEAGCDGYISKPIDRTKLNDVIGQYLGAQVG